MRVRQVGLIVSPLVRDCPRDVQRVLKRRLRRMVCMVHGDDAIFDQFTVRVVDDTEMTRLHETHLGLPGTTDVMSFPTDDPVEAPHTAGFGDVAVNWSQVRRQARGPTMADALAEATVLLVHGFAHLLGHDHATRLQGRRMHRLERALLRRLGVADIPRPYGGDAR